MEKEPCRCGGDEDGSTVRGNPGGAASGTLAAPGGARSDGDTIRCSGPASTGGASRDRGGDDASRGGDDSRRVAGGASRGGDAGRRAGVLVVVEVMDVVLLLAMHGALVVMTEGLVTMKCRLMVPQVLLVVTNGVLIVWNGKQKLDRLCHGWISLVRLGERVKSQEPNRPANRVPLPNVQFGVRVARPNTVVLHTQAFKDISVREIMDSVLKCVKQNAIKTLQQFAGPRYCVTFRSADFK
ncbi:Hypothetical predicted protein [Paramuricea clavata]|uniref:Uncharacterized protein n=1 Tax=Paramuricea clavata TaxID=317549 RepID=A0A6S7I7T7_PARCT|nr:Hypothetical predicted protein [Paramuricea clavata]